MAAMQDAANWPTATATNRVRNEETMAKCAAFRKRNANQNTVPLYLEEVVLREEQHGQAAPASSNTSGSRQGLSWATPRACEAQNPPMGVDKRHHGLTHQVTKQWATPRSGKTTDENPETWALRQAKGDVATMPLGAQVKCWGTPAANDANKQNVMCEVNSKQAGLPKSVGLELQRQWGTPTARDHKSGRGNEDRQYKELTPMVERQQSGKLNPRWVETLMGLPIGWTMPSCTSPQTIAPMSCDSSAMESCLPPQSELSEFLLAS